MADWWGMFYKDSLGKMRAEVTSEVVQPADRKKAEEFRQGPRPADDNNYIISEDDESIQQPVFEVAFPDESSDVSSREIRLLAAASPVSAPSPGISPPPLILRPPPILSPPPAITSPPPPVASPIILVPSPPPPAISPSPPSPIPPPPIPPPVSPPPPPPFSPPSSALPSPPPPVFQSPPSPPPATFLFPPPPGSNALSPPPFSYPPPPSSGGLSTGVWIGIAAGGGALAVGLVLVCLFCCWGLFFATKRNDDRQSESHSGGTPLKGPGNSSEISDSATTGDIPFAGGGFTTGSNGSAGGGAMGSAVASYGSSGSFFSYAELSKATDNFALHNKLGEGGFGKVYKGILPDGRPVAVKVQNVGGGQGEREFMAEVDNLSRVHHKHLVTLLGYCSANDQRLLVYEFVPNGTVEFALHGNKYPMEWSIRMKVAIGAARGLSYLHEDCQPRIFHRDIKSSNILLGPTYDALVADFGLAKLASDTFTHVSTRVMGTFGYLAPEYAMTGKLTDKSDVFSYGVVLLELITGRKPVDERQPPGQESLVEWARPLLSIENLSVLADPRLEGRFNEDEMERMVNAAALCVRSSAPMRPKMSQVVRLLEGSGDVEDITSADNKPGVSRIYENDSPFGGTQTFDSEEYSKEMRKQFLAQKGKPLTTIQSSGEQGSSTSGGVYLYSGHVSSEMPPSSRFPSGQVPSTEFEPVPRPMLSGEHGHGHSQDYSERLQEGR